MKKFGSRQIVTLVLAAIAAVFAIIGFTQLGFWDAADGPKPGFFPGIMATVMFVICVISFIQSFSENDKVVYEKDELLIIGCGILFADLFSGGKQTLMLCVSAVLAVSLLYNGVFGMADVANTWRAVRANERTIAEARENGIGEVHVPMVKIYTKYSALYDLKYLDTEDPNSWPNHAMARSLGVEAIIGYWEE